MSSTHEPGPALDALVGQAVGIAPFTSVEKIETDKPCDTYQVIKGDEWPRFSTSWDAAMQAAEKCGLFKSEKASLIWSTGEWFFGDSENGYVGHVSGPMAICLAILALKERQ